MTHLCKAARVALLLALLMTASGLLSAQSRCLGNTIQGSYGFHYTSGLPGSPTYGVGIGVVTFNGIFNGTGQGTSVETVSINGAIVRGARSSVSYTVNQDCTGTITWTYPDFGGLVVKADLVISDNGKSIYTIGTDNGSVSLGFYTKQ